MFDKITAIAKDLHVWLTISISIGAVFLGVGFTVDPPWAKAATVELLQTQIQAIIQKQERTDRLTLQTQRTLLQAQLREAEAELKKNPESWSAQQLVQQLRDQIEEIDRALNAPH